MNASGPADRRATVVSRVAERITKGCLTHPTRVAIDGVTAFGKSTLARELGSAVEIRFASRVGEVSDLLDFGVDGLMSDRLRLLKGALTRHRALAADDI